MTSTRTGEPRPFTPRFGNCQDKAQGAEIWPVLYDQTITFQPNFFFATIPMIWKIEDTEIHQPNGSLTPNEETYTPVDGTTATKPVKIDFEVTAVGGINQLTLKTRGDDGIYSVKVRLLLKFFDNQPPMIFYEQDIPVNGQGVAGNAAYNAYIGCLIFYQDFIIRHVNRHIRIDSGTPVEQVTWVEDGLLELTNLLAGELEVG